MKKLCALKKFEIEYLKSRVKNVVMCTMGNIEKFHDKKIKKSGLTDKVKYSQILKGRASLKEIDDLKIRKRLQPINNFTVLLECFDYKKTDSMITKDKYNKKLSERVEDLKLEVEKESRGLIDDVLFGVVDSEQIPVNLAKLSDMALLLKNF